MGWRAIRISLDRPMLLRRQIRAMARAAKQCDVDISIMFPMITEVSEFLAARELFDKEVDGEGMRGRVRVGAMLEVPGLLFQLEQLLAEIDFLSVGSNDLMQFMFATDRGNPKLADRYDILSPGPLRMMASVIYKCRAADVPVSVCGEMAGRPLEAMTLIGLGYRRLSMASPWIGPVKQMTRSLDIGALSVALRPMLEGSDRTLRGKIREFALEHGVAL